MITVPELVALANQLANDKHITEVAIALAAQRADRHLQSPPIVRVEGSSLADRVPGTGDLALRLSGWARRRFHPDNDLL